MNIRNDWHTMSASDVIRMHKTDCDKGLTTKEAAKRRRKNGANRIWYIRKLEVKDYILHTVGDMSTLLLMAAAILSFIFSKSTEAVIMCIILAVGSVLRIMSYIMAARILEDNARENIPSAAVMRDGRLVTVSAVNIVPGDILILRQGDTVPCDCRIISDGELKVNENGITDNNTTIRKFNVVLTPSKASQIPPENRVNILYGGSLIIMGECRAVAVACGRHALASVKHGGITLNSSSSMPLIDRLTKWCKTSELVMLVLILLISFISLITSAYTISDIFIIATALAAASMSEYLTTIGYIIVAVAVKSRKHKGKHVGEVFKECTSIQALSESRRIVLTDVSLLKSGLVSFGSIRLGDEEIDKDEIFESADNVNALATLLRITSSATTARNALVVSGSVAQSSGEYETTVKHCVNLYTEKTGKGESVKPYPVIDMIPYTASMSGGVDAAIMSIDNVPYVVCVGEIRKIISYCTTIENVNGEIVPLTDEMKKDIFTQAAHLEFIGARIAAAAAKPSEYLTISKISTLQTQMTFRGFVSLVESPETAAEEEIKKLKDGGYEIILLSSSPEDDLYYGHEIGLFNKNTQMLSYENAAKASGPSTIIEVPSYTGYDPSHDLAASNIRVNVIKELVKDSDKDNNNKGKPCVIVSEPMDAKMLSETCGMAVSKGTQIPIAQALKSRAAVLVYPIADDGGYVENSAGFTDSVNAIRSSKRAMNNMSSAMVYLMSAQLMRLAIVILSLVFGLATILPVVILVSGVIIDFFAVLGMAFEKAPDDILSTNTKLTSMKLPALLGTLCAALCVMIPLTIDIVCMFTKLNLPESGALTSLLTVSMLLTQAVLAAESKSKYPLIIRKTKGAALTKRSLNVIELMFLFCILVVIILTAFVPTASAVISGSSANPGWLWFTVIAPPFMLFIISELYKRNNER